LQLAFPRLRGATGRLPFTIRAPLAPILTPLFRPRMPSTPMRSSLSATSGLGPERCHDGAPAPGLRLEEIPVVAGSRSAERMWAAFIGTYEITGTPPKSK
jgi:hypothetical protein